METTITREQHLQWCKDRAMEYVNRGEYGDAVASMLSDLGKHPETEKSAEIGAMIGFTVLMNPSADAATRFVQGFN